MRRSPCIQSVIAAIIPAVILAYAHVTLSQGHSISGRIVVDGRLHNYGVIVWIDWQHMTLTDSLGDYEIGGLDDGEYVVRAWSGYCLASIVDSAQVSGADVSDVSDTLIAGDFNEDGRINLFDAGEILAAYGATPDSAAWDGILDLSGSGVIDSLDIDVLMGYWKDGSDFEVDLPSGIEITEPASYTIWHQGQSNVPISWETGILAGDVSLYLFKGASCIDTIALSTPNDGSYGEYDVPAQLPLGEDYRVLLYYNDYYTDMSDSFELGGPCRNFIEILEPTSETVWMAGQRNVEIRWDPDCFEGDVRIVLLDWWSYGYGVTTASTPNDGSYFWDVPYFVVPGSYQIGIILISNNKYWRGEFFDVIPNEYVWVQQAVPGCDVDLHDVSFTSADTGTVVGNGGTILRTVDGGETWVPQSGTSYYLSGVCFLDGMRGTAVGGYGTILRTEDGGENWATQTSGTTNHLRDVCFTDVNTGVVVGNGGVILRTTDGGATWIEKPSGTGLDLSAVSFTDSLTGTVVAHAGLIMRTTDGCNNWEIQMEPPESPYTCSMYDVAFTDASTGTVVAGIGNIYGPEAWSKIYRTTDGGENWVEQDWPRPDDWLDTDPAFLGVTFLDNQFGAVVMSWGEMLRTMDGGANWYWQHAGGTASLNSIVFVDDTTGTAVGPGCKIVRLMKQP
jgi:photosystem II stability/assembly factor-like uncharacterized protein